MRIWFFDKNRGGDLLRKIEALQSLKASSDLLDQFYKFLTVLDSKATGLLTADAVVVAILVAFLALPQIVKTLSHDPAGVRLDHVMHVLEIQVVLIAISALLCLLVVSVGWSMLDKLPPRPTRPEDCHEELRWLANVVDDRTHYYWIAWFLTLAAFLMTFAWWSWRNFVIAAVIAFFWWLIRR